MGGSAVNVALLPSVMLSGLVSIPTRSPGTFLSPTLGFLIVTNDGAVVKSVSSPFSTFSMTDPSVYPAPPMPVSNLWLMILPLYWSSVDVG